MEKNRFKSTSIQVWDKLVRRYFGKSLHIETRKDRGEIYSKLDKMGLAREKLIGLYCPDPETFGAAVRKVGLPYWLSITPLSDAGNLKRLTLLDIKTIKEGHAFLDSIKNLKGYKILVIQYPTQIIFKGSALVSESKNGIVEFVRGDNHLKLISGRTMEDPMLFSESGIIHYSNIIFRRYQNELFGMIRNNPGHYEFQYAKLKSKKGFSFFDFNDEAAYENIDSIFHHLENLNSGKTNLKEIICRGLPVSHGLVRGKCRIILNKNTLKDLSFKKGEILITDFTSPDMVQIIPRASAIVTDLGGVTSHAAIVCRELGIPCISGTRFATTKLKQGQKIQVDASNGLVTAG